MSKLKNNTGTHVHEDMIAVNDGGTSGADFVWRNDSHFYVGVHLPTKRYPFRWQWFYYTKNDDYYVLHSTGIDNGMDTTKPEKKITLKQLVEELEKV